MILLYLDRNNILGPQSHQTSLLEKKLVKAYDKAPILRPDLVIFMLCDRKKSLRNVLGLLVTPVTTAAFQFTHFITGFLVKHTPAGPTLPKYPGSGTVAVTTQLLKSLDANDGRVMKLELGVRFLKSSLHRCW